MHQIVSNSSLKMKPAEGWHEMNFAVFTACKKNVHSIRLRNDFTE
jgi:hypothetical protein